MVRGAPVPTVRLNTKQGDTDLLPLRSEDWFCHPNGDDLAICRIGFPGEFHKFSAIPTSDFLDKSFFEGDQPSIGPGNDAFFLGRFKLHDGRETNTPTARFGNVALAQPTFIKSKETGVLQESLLVEMRSLPGYSGSPVFAVPLPYGASMGMAPTIMWAKLLGIDWCHLSDYHRVLDSQKNQLPELMYVEQNSGMMGVIPAWILLEILNMPEMDKARDEIEKKQAADCQHVILDS